MKKNFHLNKNVSQQFIFLFFSFFLLLAPIERAWSSTQNRIYIKVGEAKIKKSLLALPPFRFLGTPSSARKYNSIGVELYKTIYNDLAVASFFQFIEPEAYIENPAQKSMKPAPGNPNGFLFKNWRVIGSDFLIMAGFNVNGRKITLETYSYSIKQASLILGRRYTGSVDKVRLIAHSFTTDLIKKLTGKEGMFKSKIIVSSTRPANKYAKNKGWREIFLMDWDGFNAKPLTRHRSITLSPSWSPDGKAIAYSALVKHRRSQKRNWDLFIYQLNKDKRWLVSSRPGVNSGSTWHPNGRDLFLTISQKGKPDIFRINKSGKILDRMTYGPGRAMNVEPAIAKSGTHIAFSSDRTGKPMIYVMDTRTKKPKRVTIAGRYNASPSWSPDGKKLAFAGYDKGHFDIFSMKANGTSLIRLTTARKANGVYSNNEDPTWSPDGRHIMFISNRSGRNQLYVINSDGTNERRITFDQNNYYKPKWSPVLE